MKLNLFPYLFFSVLLLQSACNQKDTQSLNPAQFQDKINEDVTLLDVRTPEEFSISHIEGAVNINIYSDDFIAAINQLDKSKPVYVYCKSGGRSSEAAKTLKTEGFEDVFNLEGGLLKWQSENLPLKENVSRSVNEQFSLENYHEMIASNNLILFDFMAEWCGPCKMMAPHIKKLEEAYPDKLKVVKINVDYNKEISQEFNISSIPLVKIYHDGTLVHDVLGYQNEEQLRTALEKYL